MKPALVSALGALFLSAGWVAAQAPVPANAQPAPPLNGGAANAAPVLGNACVPGTPALPGLSAAVNGGPIDRNPSVYFSTDYLLWKVRSGAIPLTASTVPVGLISVDTSDLIVQGTGFVPVGGRTVGFAPVSIVSNSQFGSRFTDFGEQTGVRVTAGFWADPDMSFGIEASGFMLERGADQFAAISGVSTNQFLINTPFTQNVVLVPGGPPVATFPIFVVREASARTAGSAANALLGGELNARCIALRFGCVDFGCLVGARYVHYKDELALFNSVRLRRPDGFPVTLGDTAASISSDLTFNTRDRIRIYNNFVGGQIGTDVDAKFGALFINARLKGGVGTIFQHATVEGNTQLVNAGGGPTPPGVVTSGGLLAGPNDVGNHNKTRFGFVGEINVKLGYQLTDNFRTYVGYDGLYLGHMARAANSSVINSLNTTVTVANSSNTVSVNAPAFRFRDHDVWVRGLNFGFEFAY